MECKIHKRWTIFIVLTFLPFYAAAAAEISGVLKMWHPIALSFEGPETSEGASPNPFLEYRLNVTLTGPGGQTYQVPGYYAADGDAANTGATSGNIWRARFNADQAGQWHYKASFRKGSRVNISLDEDAGSSAGYFDGQTGAFQIKSSDITGKDFRARGQLRYVGEHYMQFAGDKKWFIKIGADSPENFWGYEEFDNTPVSSGFGTHSYSAHIKHWQEGNPTWGNGKGKGIIGVFNYLSSQGINSIYALTMNAPEGDAKDVFMWLDTSDYTRFDVSKLEQWNIVMEHANAVGVQMHLVLSERENDEEVFGKEMNDARRQYLRELVARFSHNLAIQWNLGEENKNTVSCRKAMFTYLRAQDPYKHPQVVHNEWKKSEPMYSAHLGADNFEGTSFQAREIERTYDYMLEWYQRSEQAGRPWLCQHDESHPKRIKKNSRNDVYRVQTMYGNLMAGGAGVEYIMDDLQKVDDFTQYAQTWKWMSAGADFFMDLPIDLPKLKPHDDLLSGGGKFDHCLAAPGQVYLVYIADGAKPTLTITDGEYIVKWFDPILGGALKDGSVTTLSGSGEKYLGNPPDDQKEWLVYLKEKDVEASGKKEWQASSKEQDSETNSLLHLSAAKAGVFVEEGGLLIIEAESTETSDGGDWDFLAPADEHYAKGATNQAHIEFTGNEIGSGPPNSPLVYTFRINKAGTYHLVLRALKRLEGARKDLCNDCYVKVAGDFASGNPKASLKGLKEDIRIYLGGAGDTWGWSTNLDSHEADHTPAIYVFKAGETYTLTVSGRSQRYNLDRIIFHHSDIKRDWDLFANSPESQRVQ